MASRHLSIIVVTLAATLAPWTAQAQTPLGSEFTSQAQLKEGGLPFPGSANLRFQLYDADDGGMLVGTNSVPNVPINNGLFPATLDFGGEAFFGDARWLEIAVYQVGSGYITLTPRQPLTAAPYALFALSAPTGGDADTLDGQHGSFYQNASNVNAGTLANARTTGTALNTPSTLVLRDVSGNFAAGTITASSSSTSGETS